MAGSVNYDFVQELSEDYKCTICTDVLIEPVQAGCCGQEFCQSCLSKWLEKNNTCPHCRSDKIQEKNWQDLRLKRIINDLRVHCPNKTRGCEEVITVGSQQTHLENCLFALVNCRLQCGTSTIRKNIQEHQNKQCENRLVQCQYCDTRGKYKDITTERHLNDCRRFPLPCPNKCGETGIQRRSILAHRMRCPLEPVKCSFAEAGCKSMVARKDLDQHLAENMGQHLSLVSGVAVRATQQLGRLERQFNELTTHVGCVRQELAVMTPDRKNEKQINTIRTALTTMMEPDTRYCLRMERGEDNTCIYTAPSFYVKPGYKMRVDIQYNQDGLMPYVADFGLHLLPGDYDDNGLRLLPGHYDDKVPWPIPNNIEIVLESENPDYLGGKTSITIKLCDKCNRRMDLSRGGVYRVIHELKFEGKPRCDYFYLYITIRKHEC